MAIEECVERPQFRRSRYCTSGTCVEVALRPDGSVALRDGKNPAAPEMVFSPAEWRAFLAGVKGGEFDFV